MENNRSQRVCPVEQAGGLDNKLRRYLQNPEKIVKPYIKENMTVLDLGCGPGFFSFEIAKLLNGSGTLFAADLQEGMLNKVRQKLAGTTFGKNVVLHKCNSNSIGLTQKVDFAMAFYVIHEIPNHYDLFAEMKSLLNQGGQLLIVEPKFHVTKKDFDKMLDIAISRGFTLLEQPKFTFSRACLLA